jgi:hypothetical protein
MLHNGHNLGFAKSSFSCLGRQAVKLRFSLFTTDYRLREAYTLEKCRL